MKHYIFPILVYVLCIGGVTATEKSMTLCIRPDHFQDGTYSNRSTGTDVYATNNYSVKFLSYRVQAPRHLYDNVLVAARCDNAEYRVSEPVGYGTSNPFASTVNTSAPAFCYCKMISPIVSTWFRPAGSIGLSMDFNVCTEECSYYCNRNMIGGGSMRLESQMFARQPDVDRNGTASDLVGLDIVADTCGGDNYMPIIRQGITPTPCSSYETQSTTFTIENLIVGSSYALCTNPAVSEAGIPCFFMWNDTFFPDHDDISGTFTLEGVCNEM